LHRKTEQTKGKRRKMALKGKTARGTGRVQERKKVWIGTVRMHPQRKGEVLGDVLCVKVCGKQDSAGSGDECL